MLVSSLSESKIVNRVRRRLLTWNEKRPASDIQLAELAFALPGSLHGLRYDLERSADRRVVGKVEADFGWRGPIQSYLAAFPGNGDAFEAFQERACSRVVTFFHNGKVLGECHSTRRDALATWPRPCWQLILGGQPWGSVEPGWVVGPQSLVIDRGSGPALPLHLARRDTPADFLIAGFRLVSLAWLWSPASMPGNRDLVIPATAPCEHLTEDELRFYFMLTLFFRTLVFQFELHGNL